MPVGNPVTDLSTTGNFVPVTRTLTINGVSYDLSADRSWSIASPGGGSVTSVAMSVPVGFSISGSPITTAGTLAVTFSAGYSLPTTIKQSNWDDAYTFVSNFPSQTGNNGKFLYTSGSVLSWQPVLQNPMTNYGEMIFGGTSGVPSVVSPNTTVNRQYLQQIGNGTAAFAPSWGGIISSDITGQALTSSNDTNVQITLGGTPGNSVLNAVSLTMGWTGQLSAGRGGTGTSGVTGIMLGNSTAPVTGITGIGGQILRANPSTGAYEFWTPTYMENPMNTLGDIIVGNNLGIPARLGANSTANSMYLRSVSGGSPTWVSIQGTHIVGAAITTSSDTNITITASGNTADALLRTLTLTSGWTGQLAVPRGGTGASSLTGVVIGNSTGAMTAVAGTAEQLLRRNVANTGYEFFTPTYLGNPMIAAGDMIVGNAAGAPLRLVGNINTQRRYLSQIGNGTSVTSISWNDIQGSEITGAAITTSNDTNILITASGNTTNALLRTMTLTAGWTGQLVVGRGGTGAATLTGVLIGNGTSAVTAVTGTASQLLRRNAANTAYEFFTASLISGNGVADRVAKWTSATNLIDSQIVDNGTNVGIGLATPDAKLRVSGVINGLQAIFTNIDGRGLSIETSLVAGTNDAGSILNARGATSGTLIFQTDSVERARITSSGNVGIGINPSWKLDVNGVIGLAGTAFAEKSGNNNVLYDGSGAAAISLGGTTALINSYDNTTHSFKNRGASVEFATISSSGLNIKSGHLQLPSANYITWGGAYGTNIPTISGTSGTGAFLQFYPSGSSSGVKMALRDSGQLALTSYTSSSAFTGTSVATLAVTSAGDLITIAPQQVTASGTYTPTWSGLANVTSVTAFSCQYMRVGDTVTVSGWVTIDPVIDNTPTRLSFTLPINSDTSVVNRLNGVGVTEGGGAAASIQGYATNFGEFEVSPSLATAVNYSFTFTYRIV